MAINITIAFQGLMYFQSHGDGTKHLAIVDARAHHHTEPKLDIYRSPAPGDPYKLWKKIDLYKDDAVAFGLTSGKINTDDLYNERVPELREFIIGGDIHDDVVQQRRPNNGALAFVSLPGGNMTTWGGFKERVRLTNAQGKRTRRCFARFVILESSITTPYIIVHHYPAGPTPSSQLPIETYELKNDDLIFVSNIYVTATRDPHFPAYEGLLTYGAELGRPVLLLQERCDVDAGKGQFSDLIEEALENAYQPTPNGDCGPTGP